MTDKETDENEYEAKEAKIEAGKLSDYRIQQENANAHTEHSRKGLSIFQL